jgi:RNA polymerase-interacting CarD/CdnL/TRCF family regulator
MKLVKVFRNPQAIMQQAMNNSQFMSNPISKNALEMYQKGDKQGLNELVDNLCKEKGINRSDFERQIKSQFGM